MCCGTHEAGQKTPGVFAHLSVQFENIAVFQSPHDLQLQRLDEAVLYSFAGVASLYTLSTLGKERGKKKKSLRLETAR